jgi:hypothetical protein
LSEETPENLENGKPDLRATQNGKGPPKTTRYNVTFGTEQ